MQGRRSEQARRERRTITIAIASESTVVRTGLRVMLASAGDMRVIAEVSMIADAARLIAVRPPDLLFVVLLRDISEGLAALQRARRRLLNVPCVVVTVEPSRAERSQAPTGPYSDCVSINVTRAELVAAARRVARGAAWSPWKSARGAAQPFPGLATTLTAPEIALLRLLSEGLTNDQIAGRLGYSVGTVKDYVQRILEKLDASNRTQAAVKAVRAGMLN
jgi:two-component system, NarL family, response regulator LiaR